MEERKARLLKGAPAAAALTERTKKKAEALKAEGILPTLAIVRVGERPDDLSYERGALKRAEKTGITVRQVHLPSDCSQEALMKVIRELNEDDTVHGVLIFRPLPKTLNEQEVCDALRPEKDVDGITAGSMAHVYSGRGAGFAPCTAQSVMEILQYYGISPEGKKAAVIGRSLVIGRPAAMLLMQANATVTICHTRTKDLARAARQADLIVAAVGHAESIGKDCFREGQTVIDVGINWSEEKQKFVGDICSEEALPVVADLTPVPGGVGSVTTAVLCSHVTEAAEAARQKVPG